jgi:hypothetical protein
MKKKAPTVAKRQKEAVVGKKRFKASSGKYAEVTVLDANTATFGTDLLKVSDYSARRIVSPTTNDARRLWIVAGPNGSGKTSMYDNADIEDFGRSVWIINPTHWRTE